MRRLRENPLFLMLLPGSIGLLLCGLISLPYLDLPILSSTAPDSPFPPSAYSDCPPVEDTLNPPIYPAAQAITVEPAATPQWLGVMKTVSFYTSDTPATVTAYYRAAMARAGWILESA